MPRALVSHVLRRMTFGPHPGQVERLLPLGPQGVVESLLAAPDPPVRPPDVTHGTDQPSIEAALTRLTDWWIARLNDPGSGLAEKMTWFWHGHITSSASAVNNAYQLWEQHVLLRRHALGNFRDLVRAVTIDPAMLVFLSGDGSTGEAPNENYGRELMELFTLGHGNYTEADVRAGARALAGWSAPFRGPASFDPASAYAGTVTFLGRTGRLSAQDIADIVCAHRACAPFVAGKLHRYLVGDDPSPSRLNELATVFRGGNLEIRPLVEAIVRHPDFLVKRLNRPRYPVEWVTAACAATGRPARFDHYNVLGQVPFEPPNVAGWPPGPRWVGPGPSLARAQVSISLVEERNRTGVGDLAATLDHCSLFEVGEETMVAIRRSTSGLTGEEQRGAILAAVIACPEFALA